jgi:small multidrug resistance family-3 protein
VTDNAHVRRRQPAHGPLSAPGCGGRIVRLGLTAGSLEKGLPAVLIARSIALFVLAALLEIGGAWLVWQGLREHRGWIWIGAGVLALGAYGFVATWQPDAHFGRILAAYGGVFVAGSLVWGMVMDGFRPDRWDVAGALVCLVGVAIIMYVPRT